MGKILLKGFCFLILFVLCDRWLGYHISSGAIKRQLDHRLGRVLERKIQPQVIILGSSRAARDVIASEFEKASGLSTYNLGYPGSNIDFHEMLLREIVESGCIPEKVILAIDDDTEVIEEETINFRFDVIYPYVKFESINREICVRKKINLLITRLSDCYRERPNFKQALDYSLKGPMKPDLLNTIQADGSMPIDGKSVTYEKMAYSISSKQYDPKRESPFLREKLVHFVRLCKQYRIQLIILFSPNFFTPTIGFEERMRELVGETSVYLNYSTAFLIKGLYYDGYHLDRKGAEVFSKILGEKVRSYGVGQFQATP
jgi:hypothetical protein